MCSRSKARACGSLQRMLDCSPNPRPPSCSVTVPARRPTLPKWPRAPSVPMPMGPVVFQYSDLANPDADVGALIEEVRPSPPPPLSAKPPPVLLNIRRNPSTCVGCLANPPLPLLAGFRARRPRHLHGCGRAGVCRGARRAAAAGGAPGGLPAARASGLGGFWQQIQLWVELRPGDSGGRAAGHAQGWVGPDGRPIAGAGWWGLGGCCASSACGLAHHLPRSNARCAPSHPNLPEQAATTPTPFSTTRRRALTAPPQRPSVTPRSPAPTCGPGTRCPSLSVPSRRWGS